MDSIHSVTASDRPLDTVINPQEKDLIDIVYDWAVDFFEFMKECLHIPFRLIGSKHFSILGVVARLPLSIFEAIRQGSARAFVTNLFNMESGYEYFTHREASMEEVKDNLGYAAITAYIHNDNISWLKPLGYKECDFSDFCDNIEDIGYGCELVNGCLISRESGLKMRLIQTNTGYTVVFGAVNSLRKTLNTENIFMDLDVCTRSLDQVFTSFIGIRSKLYKAADKAFAKLLKSEKLKGENISLTGGCFGAAIASYLGIKHEKKAVCFNPLSIGCALQADIGDEKLKHAKKYVTNFISKTDFVADTPLPFTIVDIAFNTFGVRTSGIYGNRVYVNTAYCMYSMNTHTGSYNNLLHHIDMDINLRPKDFPQELTDHIKAKL